MNQNLSRIVSGIHLALAAILSGLYLYLIIYLAGIFNFEAKFARFELLYDMSIYVSGIVVLIGAFLFFNKNPRIHKFSVEAVEEFTRVTWPTKIEVRAATIVVAIFVIISSIIMGGFDVLVNRLIAFLIGI